MAFVRSNATAADARQNNEHNVIELFFGIIASTATPAVSATVIIYAVTEKPAEFIVHVEV